MARTKAYDRQIYNAVRNINRRLLDIERKLGMDSEQYRRYVNSITAAAPEGSYAMDPSTGRIRMKTGKSARSDIKIGQLRSTLKNPTVKESIRQVEKQIAITKKKQAEASGDTSPVTVSEQEALAEMGAKQKISDWETEHGKLRYDDSVKSDMAAKGQKTYTQLANILEKGKKNSEKRAKQREYYQQNKDRINARRRERRRAGKNTE